MPNSSLDAGSFKKSRYHIISKYISLHDTQSDAGSFSHTWFTMDSPIRPFFQATQASKVDTIVVCGLVSQNGTMSQSVVTFLSIHQPGQTSKDSRPSSLSWPSLPSNRHSLPSNRPSRPFSLSWPSSLPVARLFNHSAQQWMRLWLSIELYRIDGLHGHGRLVGGLNSKDIQRIFKGWHRITKFYTMFASLDLFGMMWKSDNPPTWRNI